MILLHCVFTVDSPESLIQVLDLLEVLCQWVYWASLLLSDNDNKEEKQELLNYNFNFSSITIYKYYSNGVTGIQHEAQGEARTGIQNNSNHWRNDQFATGGGAFGLTELKRSSSSSSANRLCDAGFAELSLEL